MVEISCWHPSDSPSLRHGSSSWGPTRPFVRSVKYVDAYSATLKTGTINHYHCSIPFFLGTVTYYASEFDELLRMMVEELANIAGSAVNWILSRCQTQIRY